MFTVVIKCCKWNLGHPKKIGECSVHTQPPAPDSQSPWHCPQRTKRHEAQICQIQLQKQTENTECISPYVLSFYRNIN